MRYLNPRLRYYYSRFLKTDGRYIEILLPVFILAFIVIVMPLCIGVPNFTRIDVI